MLASFFSRAPVLSHFLPWNFLCACNLIFHMQTELSEEFELFLVYWEHEEVYQVRIFYIKFDEFGTVCNTFRNMDWGWRDKI